jgi:hypothetical protein
MKKIAPRAGLLVMLALTAGCAGAQVGETRQVGQVVEQRPAQIVVYPFAIDPSEVTLNQSIVQKVYRGLSGANADAEQQQLGHQTAQNLCVQIAADLSQKGYPAACQPRGTAVMDNTLIVDGYFSDINEGNRLRRLVIGFGAGASSLDTNVDVYQRADYITHEVLEFQTHADSGKMPGVAVTGAPGLAVGGTAAIASTAANVAVGGAKAYTSSTGHMVDETARQIVNEVAQFYSDHGWGAPSTTSPGG